MLGIGAFVLVVLLATGSSLRTPLPFAFLLACPLMMGGMMVMVMMMRGGNGRQQGNDAPIQRDHNAADHRNQDAPESLAGLAQLHFASVHNPTLSKLHGPGPSVPP